ncbi:hypothetical protein BGC_00530 [Burkholderia sp. 3C]
MAVFIQMETLVLNRYKLGVLLTTVAIACAAHAQAPAGKPERIRGDIVSFQGDVLTVHRNSGDTLMVHVSPTLAVAALKAASLADAKVGTYVGAAALTGAGGKLTATALIVFPEAARGTGEGHFPYDFGPNSTMTNANVASVVTGVHGRELQLSYKGGSNVVTVPDNVPVVTLTDASRADLIAGKKVFVVAVPAASGMEEARVLFVERDGVVPKF